MPLLPPIPTDFNSKGTRFICVQYTIPDEIRKIKKITNIQKLHMKSLVKRIEKIERKVRFYNFCHRTFLVYFNNLKFLNYLKQIIVQAKYDIYIFYFILICLKFLFHSKFEKLPSLVERTNTTFQERRHKKIISFYLHLICHAITYRYSEISCFDHFH